jgi:hypothetical protein
MSIRASATSFGKQDVPACPRKRIPAHSEKKRAKKKNKKFDKKNPF